MTLRALSFKRFHLSVKSGPNGPGNALWASPIDLISLPDKLLESIYTIGGPKLKEAMTSFRSFLLGDDPAKHYLLSLLGIKSLIPGGFRKLSSFPDKELKTRTIAIGDYYSQTALIPFHKWLFRVLKNISQDATYNQNAFKECIEGASFFASVDLTAATDRFPIDQIIAVLASRIPKEFLSA